MDHLYSTLIRSSNQNNYNQCSKRMNLIKNNFTTNKIFNPIIDNKSKYSSNYNYNNGNYNTFKKLQFNTLNENFQRIHSQREIEASTDNDVMIPSFINDNITILEKKMQNKNRHIYSYSQLNYNNNINDNKSTKISNSIKQYFSKSKSQTQDNENMSTNTGLINRSCFDHNTSSVEKNNNKKQKELKNLYNNYTEINVKKTLQKDKNLSSDFSSYLIDEYKSKLDDNYYFDKYNELEKEFKILKNSIIDYQKKNKELKKEISDLKKLNNNVENLNPIKENKKIEYNLVSFENNNLELILKENDKLLNENKIYKNQIEEYVKKIKELLSIIKNKDNYIKLLKAKIISSNNINKNRQNIQVYNQNIKNKNRNNIKEGNINKSVDKLILENEQNKEKIKQIFERIKDLGNFEKEYKHYINSNLKANKEKAFKENGTPKKNIYEIKNNNKIDYKIQKNEVLFIKDINKYNNNSQKSVDHINRIQKIENIKLNGDIYISKRSKFNEIKNRLLYQKPKNGKDIDREIDKEIKQNDKEQKNEKNKENNIDNKKDSIKKEDIKNNSFEKPKYKSPGRLGKRNNRFSKNNESKSDENINKNKELLSKDKVCCSIKEDFENNNRDVKEEIKENDKKRNHTYKCKYKKKITILRGIDITDINTSKPVRIQSTYNFNSTNINDKYLFLFGLDKDENFLQFDLITKKWLKQKNIYEIEDISDTFKTNYEYENSIFYNTLNGIFILTGKNTNILYFYNAISESIIKICQFICDHHGGSLLLDTKKNRLFVFGGKTTKVCEYYSFTDKKIYRIPQLNYDKINSSFAILNNKIYSFFGYSNLKKKYIYEIEYIDNQKLDKWNVITKINSNFDKIFMEKMATFMFNEKEPNCIYLYSGIKKKETKEIINEENIFKFDTKTNKIDKVKNINYTQYKFIGSRWRKCDISCQKYNDIFEFEKNSNFIQIPHIENNNNDNDNSNRFVPNYKLNNVKVLIDSNNNVHYIFFDSKNVEIFKCYYK